MTANIRATRKGLHVIRHMLPEVNMRPDTRSGAEFHDALSTHLYLKQQKEGLEHFNKMLRFLQGTGK